MNKYKQQQFELTWQFTAKEFHKHSFIIHSFKGNSRKYNCWIVKYSSPFQINCWHLRTVFGT